MNSASINKTKILKKPIHFIAFGLGLGFSPFAPGTCGTLLGVIIYILNRFYFNINELALIIVTFILGIYICGKTAKDLKYHDHPGIVWDEVVGYLITMVLIPFSYLNIVIGFVLFRIFDILKPWPIGTIDKNLGGGLGIMLDDVLAGIYACLILHFILYLNLFGSIGL